jgi:hypothetical protein
MERVDNLRKSLEREDSGGSAGAYQDPSWYCCSRLPLFIKGKRSGEDELKDKPIFHNRVPGGGNFNPGPKGSEAPCKLNLIDILDVKRHWTVMEEQGIKHGTMDKKFHVTAGNARRVADRHGTTHNPAQLARRSKEELQDEVPLIYLPTPLLERCAEAEHSHAAKHLFPMGCTAANRQALMNEATADVEVAHINTAVDRGHGDLRNASSNIGIIPTRLVSQRAISPEKLARSATSASMMSSGTMISERTFSSPGLPEEGFGQAGFSSVPMGLPHITFAKKRKPPKIKPWMTRRGSLTTLKSKGWSERDMSRSLSSLA